MQHIMVGVLTLYEVFAYFFLYSFLGWVTEVAFHAVTQGKFVNRGFLNGPVCPIYGTGMVAVLLILGEYVSRPWAVFLVGVALPTAIELVTGWVLERFFHNKWWDYSSRRFNLKGYICLEFSICGALPCCLRWRSFILPPCGSSACSVSSGERCSLSLCSALLLADQVITILQVLKLNRILGEIDRAAERMRKGVRPHRFGRGECDALCRPQGKGGQRALRRAPGRAGRPPSAPLLQRPSPNLRSRRSPEAVKLARERLLLLQARLKARKEHRKEEKRKKKGG